MLSIVFDRDNPSETIGTKEVKCCGCQRPIVVEASSLSDYRSMCPDCSTKFQNGELNQMTWYHWKAKKRKTN